MFKVLDTIITHRTDVNQRCILFISDIRGEIGGNFKYIEEYMRGRNCFMEYDFKPGKNNKRSFSQLKDLSRKMSTAKYVLLEDYFHFSAYKKWQPGQEICQVWHGAGAFKKFAHSRAAGGDNIKIHKGYRQYAKAITSSEDINWCYQEAFSISEDKVRATGIPATDLYFDDEMLELIRYDFYEAYPELKGKKIILFAPTYRAGSQRDASYDYGLLDLEYIRENLSDEYVFAFKWHPAMYENMKNNSSFGDLIKKFNGFFVDLSSYRDIGRILPVVDTLVTDYSSIIFDYYLLNKPIVFYSVDKEEYEDSRGLYYDYEDYTYGPVTETTAELTRAIKEEDMFESKREAFGKKFMAACDGNSTEKTCRWFFGDML